MGYYSSVKMIINFEEKETSEVLKEIENEKWFSLFDEIKISSKKNLIQLSNIYIKWYYEEETKLREWFDKLDEIEWNNGGVHFVRIGDDYDDFEERVIGCPNHYVDYYRELRDPCGVEWDE